MTTKPVCFSIAVNPFPVFVDFVSCDENDCCRTLHFADCLQNVGRAQYIRGKSVDRLIVRPPDERLRCEVKDNRGLGIFYCFANNVFISNITRPVDDALSEF